MANLATPRMICRALITFVRYHSPGSFDQVRQLVTAVSCCCRRQKIKDTSSAGVIVSTFNT